MLIKATFKNTHLSQRMNKRGWRKCRRLDAALQNREKVRPVLFFLRFLTCVVAESTFATSVLTLSRYLKAISAILISSSLHQPGSDIRSVTLKWRLSLMPSPYLEQTDLATTSIKPHKLNRDYFSRAVHVRHLCFTEALGQMPKNKQLFLHPRLRRAIKPAEEFR